MSDQQPRTMSTSKARGVPLDALAEEQHIAVTASLTEFVTDLWASDEELAAFMAAVAEDRRLSLS